jgi:hypothetical protein
MKYLYLKVSIVLTCGKHLYDDVIVSPRGEVYKHITSLTLPLLIEVPVPNKESGRSCIYVIEVSNLPLSTVFVAVFRNCSDSVIFLVFI